MVIQFSKAQQMAQEQVSLWLETESEEKPVFKLFGYAGTGKSTIANSLANGLQVQYMAFTGKAASVMREKGCINAATVHSSIYVLSRKRIVELRKKLASTFDLEERLAIEKEIIALENKPHFVLNPMASFLGYDLIILDECSMINEQIGNDLLSFNVPILVLGDPFQLPPVSGEGFFTSGQPDVLLDEVHRQAKENPILRIATAIRSHEPYPMDDSGKALCAKQRATLGDLLSSYEQGGQVLAGRNATRVAINQKMRQALGFSQPYPMPGDKLVCLQNNRDLGLLNGTLWRVRMTEGVPVNDILKVELQDESSGDILECEAHLGKLNGGNMSFFNSRPYGVFDFGYCLTVHKAQGSQWDSVILVDESSCFKEMAQRWLYTGVTRAAKELIVCSMAG